MTGVMRRGLWWLMLAVVIAVVDQGTKYLALSELPVREAVPVFPFLNFTLTSNPGGAFSFLSNQEGWQRWFFIVVSVVVSAVLIKWLLSLRVGHRTLALALTLVLGGALGNLSDRIILGEVTDYIDVYYVKDFFGEDLGEQTARGSFWKGYLYRGNVYHAGKYYENVFYRGWHWPAFNVADSAIFIGALLLFVVIFRSD